MQIISKIWNRIKGKLLIIKTICKEGIYYIKFQGGTETNALLLCHALEKGMGIKNVKNDYGKEKANKLIELLDVLIKQGKTSSYVFIESCTVLMAYFDYKKSVGEDVSSLEEKYKKLNIPEKMDLYSAGYDVITKEQFLDGTKCDFEKLILSKHSLRLCSNESVNKDEFLKAIEYAKQAPSACNRQPWKVYYNCEDKKKNEALAKLVPGNKAFESDVPYYCVITVDRKYFVNNEIYQWYVNGGIFVTYLSLALHSLGIGSCIFQYPDFFKTEKEIRKLCNIKKSEVITSILGYGKYPNETKCIKAYRKPNNEIVQEI